MRVSPLPLLILSLSLLAMVSASSATVIFATDFTGITTSSNTTRSITWTVGDTETVSLAADNTTIAGSTFATSGWLYHFEGDGITIAGNRNTGAGQAQFNVVNVGRSASTPPQDVAMMSFAFTVAPTYTLTIQSATLVLGTAQTSGVGYTSLAGLGSANVVLTNGTQTYSFSAAGVALDTVGGTTSLPTTVLSPEAAIILSAGDWRLNILHFGKPSSGNGSQRTTLDSFSLDGSVQAIPEPSAAAALLAASGLLLLAARRRR